MDLRISGVFHQIVPIRFKIKWYMFSMSITTYIHCNTDSWFDVTSVNFNSPKVHEDKIFKRQDILQFLSQGSKYYKYVKSPTIWYRHFKTKKHAARRQKEQHRTVARKENITETLIDVLDRLVVFIIETYALEITSIFYLTQLLRYSTFCPPSHFRFGATLSLRHRRSRAQKWGACVFQNSIQAMT